jgi:hypothetical protein
LDKSEVETPGSNSVDNLGMHLSEAANKQTIKSRRNENSAAVDVPERRILAQTVDTGVCFALGNHGEEPAFFDLTGNGISQSASIQ